MKGAHLLGEFDAARFADDGHSNLSGQIRVTVIRETRCVEFAK